MSARTISGSVRVGFHRAHGHEHGVERRAQFVAEHGEEVVFRCVGALGRGIEPRVFHREGGAQSRDPARKAASSVGKSALGFAHQRERADRLAAAAQRHHHRGAQIQAISASRSARRFWPAVRSSASSIAGKISGSPVRITLATPIGISRGAAGYAAAFPSPARLSTGRTCAYGDPADFDATGIQQFDDAPIGDLRARRGGRRCSAWSRNRAMNSRSRSPWRADSAR